MQYSTVQYTRSTEQNITACNIIWWMTRITIKQDKIQFSVIFTVYSNFYSVLFSFVSLSKHIQYSTIRSVPIQLLLLFLLYFVLLTRFACSTWRTTFSISNLNFMETFYYYFIRLLIIFLSEYSSFDFLNSPSPPLPTYLTLHRLSIYLSIYLAIYLSIYLSIICLFVRTPERIVLMYVLYVRVS